MRTGYSITHKHERRTHLPSRFLGLPLLAPNDPLPPVYRHSRRVAAFTVLELMVVIGMLSVLLAIVLPVFRSTREAALRMRAKVEATALAQAVIQYKNVYGYWPGMVTESGGNLTQVFPNTTPNWPLVSKYSNDWFTVNVTATAGGSSSGPANYITDNTLYRSLLSFDAEKPDKKNLNPLNPRRIRFIELADEQDPSRVSLPDPWGNQYIVIMGLNPSTTFTHEFKNQSGAVIQRLSVSNLTAFALSLGADTVKTNSYLFSAGVN